MLSYQLLPAECLNHQWLFVLGILKCRSGDCFSDESKAASCINKANKFPVQYIWSHTITRIHVSYSN